MDYSQIIVINKTNLKTYEQTKNVLSSDSIFSVKTNYEVNYTLIITWNTILS